LILYSLYGGDVAETVEPLQPTREEWEESTSRREIKE
jgi:hypothetical protein